jgi:hypothetical protein
MNGDQTVEVQKETAHLNKQSSAREFTNKRTAAVTGTSVAAHLKKNGTLILVFL